MNIKRMIKEGASDALYGAASVFKRNTLPGGRIRILMYHTIEDTIAPDDTMCLAVSTASFRMQMRYLREHGFNVVDIAGISEMSVEKWASLPEKTVAITFDDGFKGVTDKALPVLRERGFPATLFVNVHYIEKRIPSYLYWSAWRTCGWDELRSARDSGLSIGSHGFTHKRLAGMGKEELSFEVTRSKDIIEKNTGGPIRAFCYPHGAFDANVKEAVKSAGFGCASSGIEGVNTPGSDIFELRRTEITSSDDTELKFEKKLFGYHDWLGHLGVHR